MKKIDLYTYLETLDNKEWDQFRHFLLMTKKEDTYEYRLLDFLSDRKSSLPDLPGLQNDLFPHLSTKAVGDKCSLLKKQLEQFFIWKNVSTQSGYNDALLHEALLSRSLYGQAVKLRKKVVRDVSNAKNFSIGSFYTLHRIYHQSFFSYAPDKYSYGDLLLENSEYMLSKYQGLISSQYKLEKANRRVIGIKDNHPQELKEVIIADKLQRLHHIMGAVLKMIEAKSHKDYQQVYDFLFDPHIFRSSELYIMFLMLAIQFRIREIRGAYHTLDTDLLDLYQLGLEVEAFSYRGYISARTFGNIIDFTCVVKKFDVAENILKKYAKDLEPSLRDEIILLAECQILMAKGNYTKALSKLEDLELDYIDHEMRYRWLKLACLYEEQDDRFESFRNSFRIWVKRDKTKLTTGIKEGLLNFISIISQLANNTPIELIRKEYDSKKNIMFRSWINGKLKNDPLLFRTKGQ